jgi:hypothetical protein
MSGRGGGRGRGGRGGRAGRVPGGGGNAYTGGRATVRLTSIGNPLIIEGAYFSAFTWATTKLR